jgi:diacylglycerol O-acyltransferase / wax synthase
VAATRSTSRDRHVTGIGARPGRFTARLNESDAVLWSIERDPCLRTTIVAIALLDRVPEWDRLRTRIVETSLAISRLRQRVVATPMRLGPPRWEVDDRFDIDYHLRRVAVPAPGDFAAVLELAAPIAMAAFDKERPLWEFTLVEGLTDGRAALIEKLHHVFIDGVGGMMLARTFVDDEPDPPVRHSRRRRPSEPAPSLDTRHPGLLGSVTDAASDAARSTAAVTARVVRVLPGLAAKALGDPIGLAGETTGGARSIGRLLRPASAPQSPIMRGRGLSRRLRAFDVSLEDALAAAHAAGGTLNDAFLAAVAGGMRRYHERNGSALDGLRVTMPVNLRSDDDPIGNNRFTPVRFTLPITEGGPVDRMHQLGELARRWRREPALPISDVIAGALNRLPVVATTALFGSLLKGVDLVVTNVPGFTGRVYLAGAEVLRHYAFPPPSGAACGIALLSHVDRACIGITIDTAAVPDADLFSECLQEGFAEVLAGGHG